MKFGKNRKAMRVRIIFPVIITVMALTILVLSRGLGNSLLPWVSNTANERYVLHGKMEWEETDGIQSSLVYGGKGDSIRNFVAYLKEHIAALEGHYGVYFLDISSGLEFGVNEKDEFYAASTVKIPLALYL